MDTFWRTVAAATRWAEGPRGSGHERVGSAKWASPLQRRAPKMLILAFFVSSILVLISLTRASNPFSAPKSLVDDLNADLMTEDINISDELSSEYTTWSRIDSPKTALSSDISEDHWATGQHATPTSEPSALWTPHSSPTPASQHELSEIVESESPDADDSLSDEEQPEDENDDSEEDENDDSEENENDDPEEDEVDEIVDESAHDKNNRRLVVLVPANRPDPNLCKFLFSAIALGYPSPVIVNWGRDPFEMSKWEGGPNLSKISGIMRYLDAVLHWDAHDDDKLHPEDIVVIADGFDVWFQLPPEVLLKRYHAINSRAMERLRKQWTHPEPMPMSQTIVVASQKRCFPDVSSGSNLHCDELPSSPLRHDLYGPDTDKMIEPENWHDIRPRYINGGVYIGAAGDLRRMFRRAFDKVDSDTSKGIHLFSEQGISGEVLGEQETWRNWRRQNSMSSTNATDLMQRDFEYHIGLDYAQELSIPTCHAEPDGQIVAMSNQSAIAAFSGDLGIFPSRVQGVPDDVRAAAKPLDSLSQPADWADMPLYVDFFTTTVPALLHHNAWKDGLKQRRIWWWDRMWFFPYLRDLLAVKLEPGRPLSPLGHVATDAGNITYWAPSSDRLHKKPRTLIDKAFEPLPEIEFDEVCHFPDENGESKERWWDEVFRDGKGPL